MRISEAVCLHNKFGNLMDYDLRTQLIINGRVGIICCCWIYFETNEALLWENEVNVKIDWIHTRVENYIKRYEELTTATTSKKKTFIYYLLIAKLSKVLVLLL